MIKKARYIITYTKVNNTLSRFFVTLYLCLVYLVIQGIGSNNNTVELLQPIVGILLFLLPGWAVTNEYSGTIEARVVYVLSISTVINLLSYLTYNLVWLRASFLPKPISMVPFITVTVALVFSSLFKWEYPSFGAAPLREYTLISVLFLITIVGTHLINVSGNSIIILGVLLLLSLILPFSINIGEIERLTLLAGVALILLYQDVLLVTGMTGGDQPMEYYLANITLMNEFWDPGVAIAHYELLRISLLHPAMKELTGLSLFWSMKLISPLYPLFLVFAVYAVTRETLNEQAAYFGTLSYITLFPYFTRLSRDGRSSAAIFFAAVLFLILVDSSFNRRRSFLFGAMASVGLVMSHEGIAVIALGIIGGAAILSRSRTGLSLGILGGICAFLLYAYTTDAVMFKLLVGVFVAIITKIEQFGIGSSAAQAIRSSNQSFTILLTKVYFITLIAFAGIGAVWNRASLIWENKEFSTSDGIAIFSFAFLGATFAPVSIMGIQRSIMIGSVAIIGFAYYAFSNIITTIEPRFISPEHIFTVVLVFGLLINTGLIGTLINERTMQPNLDREDIYNSEDNQRLFNLKANYAKESELTASKWSIQRIPSNSNIYGSSGGGLFGSYFYFKEIDPIRPPGPYSSLQCPGGNATYVYQGEFEIRSGYMTYGSASYTHAELFKIQPNRGKIYSSGSARVLYYQNGSPCY